MTEIDALKKQIAALERDLHAIARHTPGYEPKSSQSSGRAIADSMWKCRKCRSLLGFYDIEEDILRMRYKDLVAFIKIGGANTDAMAEAAVAIGAAREVSPEIIAEIMEGIAEFIDPGLVQVVCRHCSAVNTENYSPVRPESPG